MPSSAQSSSDYREKALLSHDGSFINSDVVQRQVHAIAARCRMASVSPDVIEFIQSALHERLRGVVEHLVDLSNKRIDRAGKVLYQVTETSNTKSALSELAIKDQEEQQIRKEREQQYLESLYEKKKSDPAFRDKIEQIKIGRAHV